MSGHGSEPDRVGGHGIANVMQIVANEVAALVAGSALAAALLAYLHGSFQPDWALLCGVLGSLVVRNAVAPVYASFPGYLRRALGAGVAALGVIVATWGTLALQPASYWVLRRREAITLPVLAAILGVGLAGVVYTHARMRREIEESRAREAALREAALQAQLRALQAQINPHFLFNAFNALAELTHEEPGVAEQLVADLAFLLRYSLRSSVQGLVPLSQELEAVDRYLRVEHARLGDRLRVERRVEPDATVVPVPGLVLQPLVENAVQHAVASRASGGTVRIVVQADPDSVLVAVEDDGPGIPPEVLARLESDTVVGVKGAARDLPGSPVVAVGTGGAGGGLLNVKRRLELLYRGGPGLKIQDLRPGLRVEFRVPTDARAGAASRSESP